MVFGERWGTIPNKLTPSPEHWGQSAHACRTLSATQVKSFSVNFIVTSLPCFPLKETPMLARWTPLCFSFPSDFSPFVFFLRFLKNPFKRAFQVTNRVSSHVRSATHCLHLFLILELMILISSNTFLQNNPFSQPVLLLLSMQRALASHWNSELGLFLTVTLLLMSICSGCSGGSSLLNCGVLPRPGIFLWLWFTYGDVAGSGLAQVWILARNTQCLFGSSGSH